MGQPWLCGARPPLIGRGGAVGFGHRWAACPCLWQGLPCCWQVPPRLCRAGLCVLRPCRCSCSAAPWVGLM